MTSLVASTSRSFLPAARRAAPAGRRTFSQSPSSRAPAAAALAPRPRVAPADTGDERPQKHEYVRRIEDESLSPDKLPEALSMAGRRGHIQRAQKLFAQMQEHGFTPDVTAYKAMVTAFGMHGLYPQALRTAKDMQRALRVDLDDEMLRLLIIACARRRPAENMAPLLAELERRDPTGAWEDESVIRKHRLMALPLKAGHLEHALRLMRQAEERGKPLEREELVIVFGLAVADGETEAARGLLRRIEPIEDLGASVERNVILLLGHAARQLNLDCTRYVWNVLSAYPALVSSIPSKLLINTMQCAARHGDASFCFEILPHLQRRISPSPLEEHHLAPVVEALSTGRQVKEAVEMVIRMENSGATPTATTVAPLVEAFTTPPPPSPDSSKTSNEKERIRGWNPSAEARIAAVDSAYEICRDLAVEKAQKVPLVVLNALLLACARLPDLVRTLETYRELKGTFGVDADRWSFEILLEACFQDGNESVADALLEEMKSLGLEPSEPCYHWRIRLHLRNGQEGLEPALSLLASIKEKGLSPEIDTYAAIAVVLYRSRDPRWRMLVEEAKERGFDIEKRIGLPGSRVPKDRRRAAGREARESRAPKREGAAEGSQKESGEEGGRVFKGLSSDP